MMSGILLYAFAAALLGGIDNPGGAVLGGFLVGVLENLLGAYVVGTELKLTVALVLIIGVLVVRPSGLFGRTTRNAGYEHMSHCIKHSAPNAQQAADSSRAGSSRLLLVALARCRSWSSNYHTFQLTLVLVYAIALLGLNILTGYNGQISLGHGAFYAIGAYVAAILMDKLRRALLGDRAGGRGGVLRRGFPVRPAGAAAGRTLPCPGHLRARRAMPQMLKSHSVWSTGPAACRAS